MCPESRSPKLVTLGDLDSSISKNGSSSSEMKPLSIDVDSVLYSPGFGSGDWLIDPWLIDPILESDFSCLSSVTSVNFKDFLAACFLTAGDGNSKSSSSKLSIRVALTVGLLKLVEASSSANGAPNVKFLVVIFLDDAVRPLEIMSGLSVEMISYLVHSSKLSASNSVSKSWRVSKSSTS